MSFRARESHSKRKVFVDSFARDIANDSAGFFVFRFVTERIDGPLPEWIENILMQHQARFARLLVGGNAKRLIRAKVAAAPRLARLTAPERLLGQIVAASINISASHELRRQPTHRAKRRERRE